MAVEEAIRKINRRDEENRIRMNRLIDKFHMAYKIKDSEGNIFCFAGSENGFPIYRGIGGSKHIFDLCGYTVLQQYDKG